MNREAEIQTRQPEEFFSRRFGIDRQLLERTVGEAVRRRADLADLYFEYRTTELFSLEDSIVRKASRHVSHGAGVRVVCGERTGYAHTDEVTLDALGLSARTAGAIAEEGSETRSVAVRVEQPKHDLYRVDRSPLLLAADRKAEILSEIDVEARRYDPRIRNVIASLAVEEKVVLIVTDDGTIVGDHQPLVRLHVTCIAEREGRREQGSDGAGGRVELEALLAGGRHLAVARKAAERAVRNLDAAEAPAGTMTVVLGPGWPGVLLHEAVGHGLEGDFNRKGLSAFTGRIGQRVASPLCTVVDDGTLPGRRGSINCDDEGTPSGRTVLIERGVLCGYLQDRLNARLMGTRSTGNGRRQSYAHIPMPRMTNTFMMPGDTPPEDIIRSVPSGLYAVYFGGGQVDITSGKFVFSATEAYRIEGGRIGRPVRGATLIGSGPEVLQHVSMVGTDLALDEGIGTCGKDGQSVPVGVGLPTIRVDEMTVGGTRS